MQCICLKTELVQAFSLFVINIVFVYATYLYNLLHAYRAFVLLCWGNTSKRQTVIMYSSFPTMIYISNFLLDG